MSDEGNEGQALPEVESINGFAVGFSFLRFYRLHPEIGLPTSDQDGDVGGFQNFEKATLVWTGDKVRVTWLDDANRPEWLDGEIFKEFEV